jgi:O-antigen ligase
MMVALAVSVSGGLAAVSGMGALLTLFISLMTGERINFLIRACGGMLAGLLWRPRWWRYFWLVVVEVFAVIIVFRFMPSVQNRFVKNFIEQLPIEAESPYAKPMLLGVEAFYSSPITGIGPGNFGNWCAEIMLGRVGQSCVPHPHNFYAQMLGEVGAIGLILGSVFLGSLVVACFLASFSNKRNVFVATAWVVPFGLFWPLASTADFFGQWNNIFLWSAVALALSATTFKDKRDKQLLI